MLLRNRVILAILAGIALSLAFQSILAHKSPSIANAPVPTHSPVPVTESCEDLVKRLMTTSGTSLQKEDHWKSYIGRPATWTLTVTDVSTSSLGVYHVSTPCALIFYKDRAKVEKLVKGQTTTFNVTIDQFSSLGTILAKGD